MILYMVRHGQSEGNLGSPSTDPPLTPLGHRQAELVARRAEALGVDLLLSSPLTRAIQTAIRISEHVRVPITVWAEIAEKGSSPPLPARSELASRYPLLELEIEEEWWPGAETEEDAYARARLLESKLRSLGHETDLKVLMVGHGTFGGVFMSTLLGAPPCGYTRFSQNNCCISTFDLQPGRAKLVRSNDVSHLSEDMIT